MSDMPSLTDEQFRAARRILKWFSRSYGGPSECALAGYAGTGKTTLMAHIAGELHNYSKAFLAPTGKAVSVLSEKLSRAGVLGREDTVRTLHSFLYTCDGFVDGELRFTRKEGGSDKFDILIVDEASMVSKELRKDIKRYGRPVLYVGDSGQLPPVGDAEIMDILLHTDIVLKTVHRQALDNPIISLATDVRHGKTIPYGEFGGRVLHAVKSEAWCSRNAFGKILDYGDTIKAAFLCGYNDHRIRLNRRVRTAYGFAESPIPCTGEILVGLENNSLYEIFNGQQVFVRSVEKAANSTCYKVVTSASPLSINAYSGALHARSFSGIRSRMQSPEEARAIAECAEEKDREMGEVFSPYCFDYGYALTVHKAQGSEWDDVILFNISPAKNPEEYRRWLYTGMTRAREKLFIFDVLGA